jgi:hypothetical protein
MPSVEEFLQLLNDIPAPVDIFEYQTEDPLESGAPRERFSMLNSKGRKKTDHELREEFYRVEFRLQTGGLPPPPFVPSRSAFNESFVWRPQMNKQFGINIPLYRRLTGELDTEFSSGKKRRCTTFKGTRALKPQLHHDVEDMLCSRKPVIVLSNGYATYLERETK